MTTNLTCTAQVDSSVIGGMISVLMSALLTAQCKISPSAEWPKDYANAAIAKGCLDPYDFVVIGAGTAGAVVASRLSENPKYKILVLEAGGDPSIDTAVPLLYNTLQHSSSSYHYVTEADSQSCKSFINNECIISRGKMLGGTTSMNSMLYSTGSSNDYRKWPEAWKYSNVLPYFAKSLVTTTGETNPMGFLTIRDVPSDLNKDIYDLVYAGAAALNVPKVLGFTDAVPVGYTNLPVIIDECRRCSVATALLNKAAKRPNVHVIKNIQITKLNFNYFNTKLKSVDFLIQNKYPMTVNVDRELIVSSGSIETPKLLQLSGIGPAALLSQHKIPVKCNINAGSNMQDHFGVSLFIRLKGSKSLDTDLLDNIYNYLIHGTGDLSSTGTSSLTGLINSNPLSSSPFPDIQMHHETCRKGDSSAIDTLSFKEEYKNYLKYQITNYDIITVSLLLVHPKARGTVHIGSKSPADKPTITANYFKEQQDIDAILRGIKYMTLLLQTQSFKDKQAEFIQIPLAECDSFAFKSPDYWKCYMKYFTKTSSNIVGTVQMGNTLTDPNACVDAQLRLKCIRNLRIVDSSVMPQITTLDTTAPTIMIAEKASDMIKDYWNSPSFEDMVKAWQPPNKCDTCGPIKPPSY